MEPFIFILLTFPRTRPFGRYPRLSDRASGIIDRNILLYQTFNYVDIFSALKKKRATYYNHWTEIDTSFDIYLIFELVQFLGKYNIAIIVNFKLLGTVFLLQLLSSFLKFSLYSAIFSASSGLKTLLVRTARR